MKIWANMALLAVAMGSMACATSAAPVEERVGQAEQREDETVAAGGYSGWQYTEWLDTELNILTVTNVVGDNMAFHTEGEYTSFEGLPWNSTNIAACQASYQQVYTYKLLNGTWVDWLSEPITQHATATYGGGQIILCMSEIDYGPVLFGQSTELQVQNWTFSSDGESDTLNLLQVYER